uniref:Secreted protein n=1 Tax=Phakopsora pachyrhizi TaxID=170000 RepID=A0A0S1MIM4_PHAPC
MPRGRDSFVRWIFGIVEFLFICSRSHAVYVLPTKTLLVAINTSLWVAYWFNSGAVFPANIVPEENMIVSVGGLGFIELRENIICMTVSIGLDSELKHNIRKQNTKHL